MACSVSCGICEAVEHCVHNLVPQILQKKAVMCFVQGFRMKTQGGIAVAQVLQGFSCREASSWGWDQGMEAT
jgi:hypothetical protein